MNKRERRMALTNLIKQSTQTTKLSQDEIAEKVLELVNQENIKDPKQFAHRIFEELVNNLIIKGLDDEE